MEYRRFRAGNINISLLGMGAMRLPRYSDGQVDIDASSRLIRAAIDGGINYIDTAWPYDDGMSEIAVGAALADGYRQRVLIADKLSLYLMDDQSQMASTFEKSLERLGTDSIDFLLLHGLDAASWQTAIEFHALDYCEQLREEGRIRYIGFSFHDSIGLFREIIDAYPWDFCQIQLNYMDRDFQAGLDGLEYARSAGVDVVVMEPLKGGKLTDNVPSSVRDIFSRADTIRTPAQWAFGWVAKQPGVMTVLSGISNQEQLDSALQIFSSSEICNYTDSDMQIIDEVADEYRRLIKYQCTGCRYCQPCSGSTNGVAIPEVVDFLNEWHMYHNIDKTRPDYLEWIEEGHRAGDCTGCGECESRCPQKLAIRALMHEAADLFE